MNLERLTDAAEVLAWLGEQASTLPEEREDAAAMHAIVQLARLYVLEYAVNLKRGAEPYDALLTTALGQEPLTLSQKDLLRALLPPTPKPD